VYKVRRFSRRNYAASKLNIVVSDEELEASSMYIFFCYNWWSISAAVKLFNYDDQKNVKKLFLQRCLLYRASTGDYPYFVMQLFISTCNRPILGMYLCDLAQLKNKDHINANLAKGTMFFLLKHGKLKFVLL
jgi:hypothetical protein